MGQANRNNKSILDLAKNGWGHSGSHIIVTSPIEKYVDVLQHRCWDVQDLFIDCVVCLLYLVSIQRYRTCTANREKRKENSMEYYCFPPIYNLNCKHFNISLGAPAESSSSSCLGQTDRSNPPPHPSTNQPSTEPTNYLFIRRVFVCSM